MCGISVIIRKNQDGINADEAIRHMVEAQAHRGPDGTGFHYLNWESEEIWLGHNLLSLTGSPVESRQPMLSDDGHCGLVFNGEIYNAALLRMQLLNDGITFRGNSDTEVLLAWIRKNGRRGLNKLEGMYAFVFWDSRKKLLIIHRDCDGIKPLYYTRNRNYMMFASEPAGIAASGFMEFPPDKESIIWYLNYKFIPGPDSAWQGIRQLLPGECIEYWESKPMHFRLNKSANGNSANLTIAMEVAFGAVIPKDRTFGIALSGGIDSGLILAWCLLKGLKPAVFSIRFRKGSATQDDTRAVEAMAFRYNLAINWIDCNPEDFPEFITSSKPHELLVADSAFLLSRKIAEAARKKGIHVLLSGAGADEWFGGYRRHTFFRSWISFADYFSEGLKKRILSVLNPGKLAWMNWNKGSTEGLWQSAVSNCLNNSLNGLQPIPLPDSADNRLENMLNWDRQFYLPYDVLSISDAAGMAEGVEMRFPFLHPAMTAFASSIPLARRMGNEGKEILKDEFRKFFGYELTERKKQGFGIPLGEYLSAKNVVSKEIEKWLLTIETEMMEFLIPDNWQNFKEKAIAHPGKFQQEWLTLARLASWLKQHQKPTEDAAFP